MDIKHQDVFYVVVRKHETDEEVKRLGPMSAQKARRVENGLCVNLNDDDYYTQTIPVGGG